MERGYGELWEGFLESSEGLGSGGLGVEGWGVEFEGMESPLEVRRWVWKG